MEPVMLTPILTILSQDYSTITKHDLIRMIYRYRENIECVSECGRKVMYTLVVSYDIGQEV